MIDWTGIKYFKPEEFLQPDKLRPGLIEKLDKARYLAAQSFVITSSFRTVEHNKAVGGVESSAHCLAPDGFYSGIDFALLRGMTDSNKFMILNILFVAGFWRIGIYKRHFHVDIEPHLKQNVIWISDSN